MQENSIPAALKKFIDKEKIMYDKILVANLDDKTHMYKEGDNDSDTDSLYDPEDIDDATLDKIVGKFKLPKKCGRKRKYTNFAIDYLNEYQSDDEENNANYYIPIVNIKNLLRNFTVFHYGEKYYDNSDAFFEYRGSENILLIDQCDNKLISVDIIQLTFHRDHHEVIVEKHKLTDNDIYIFLQNGGDFQYLPAEYKLSRLFSRLKNTHKIDYLVLNDRGYYIITNFILTNKKYVLIQLFYKCRLIVIEQETFEKFANIEECVDNILNSAQYNNTFFMWREHSGGEPCEIKTKCKNFDKSTNNVVCDCKKKKFTFDDGFNCLKKYY